MILSADEVFENESAYCFFVDLEKTTQIIKYCEYYYLGGIMPIAAGRRTKEKVNLPNCVLRQWNVVLLIAFNFFLLLEIDYFFII